MKRDAALLGGARVFSAASAFLSLIYLAKSRPVAQVGDINASLAAIQVASLLFGLGLSTSIIYYAKGARVLAHKLAVFSCVACFLFGLLVLVICRMAGLEYTFLIFSSVSLAFLTLLSGYLQSLEFYSKYAVLVILQAAILPFSNYISISFLEGESFFLVYAAMACFLFLACCLIWMQWGQKLDFFSDGISLFGFIKYGFNSLYFNLTSALYYSADVLLLKFFLAADYLGVYSAGASLAKSSWLFVDSIGQVVFPRRVAGKLSDADYKKIARGCYLFSIVVLIGWLFVGRFFLLTFFGSNYADAYWPTSFLLFGSIFLAYYKLQSRLLAAENAWRLLSFSQLSGLLVSSICVVLLSNWLEIKGSALGQAFGFIASALVLFFFNKRRLLINKVEM